MAKSSKQTKAPSGKKAAKPISKPETESDSTPKGVSEETPAECLPPIALVFTIIACSGFLFVFSFRDVFATGRIIGGSMDEAMLVRPTYEQ
jgi:hypothetical protein